MTPRSLFNIILKILGIFFIKDFIALIPQFITFALYFVEPDTVSMGAWSVVFTLATLIAYGIIAHYLIFRTDSIIDKLKLDKGFSEQTLSLNIHRSSILSISIIVIGGILVADEVPNFCKLVFSYFEAKRFTHLQINPSTVYLIMSSVKLIIGVVLTTGQRQIVNLIELKRKQQPGH